VAQLIADRRVLNGRLVAGIDGLSICLDVILLIQSLVAQGTSFPLKAITIRHFP